jgi:hypothetical protein
LIAVLISGRGCTLFDQYIFFTKVDQGSSAYGIFSAVLQRGRGDGAIGAEDDGVAGASGGKGKGEAGRLREDA